MLPDFRVRQRDYLLELSRALTQELDLEKLLARILLIAVEMLAGQAGIIALKERDGWRVAAAHGIAPAFLSYLTPLLADEDVRELDVIELNRMLGELTYTASMGLLNGTALALVAHRQVIGVIFIFRNYEGGFTPNDRVILQSFADQAAIAVYNAQLYGQVSYEKQRLDALLDSAADGIIILNADLTIERVNDAFERIYGKTHDELANTPHNDVIRWDGDPQGSTLNEAIANGWPLTPNATLYVEGDLERDLPPSLPVGVTYAPLLSADGKLRNVIVSVRDITHFRTADELKATFISIVSHELRTPVALIKGYASTLRRDDAKWNRADVSLPALAKRIAEKFSTQSKNHTIVADFPENFPIVLADETRIEQVIANLISNSLKYAPNGEIKISGTVHPEQIVICVSDEGKGIDAKDLPHIFDRFYRSTKAVKQTKGAGLGLYLARAIVEAHGGRIWADPKPDAGARICFSLAR